MTRSRRAVARRAAGLLCLAFFAASCGSAPARDEGASEAASLAAAQSAASGEQAWQTKPWTQRFQQPAALVAEEIFISGPKGLLDHVVTSTLVLEGEGRVGDFVGGYSDWLSQRKVTSNASKGKSKKVK